MRAYSRYLDVVKNERVAAKHNLAGSTPPTPIAAKNSGKTVQAVDVTTTLAKMLRVKAFEVALCPGSSQALFQTLAAITQPGDRIAVEIPTYEPFLAAARFLNLKLTRFKRSGDFTRDLKAIKTACRGTKAILISNPHCPTGFTFSPSELTKIAKLGPKVVVDEVYLPLFSDGKMTSLRHRNLISIGGLSKSIGYSACRLGWVAADRTTIEKVNRIALNLNIDMPQPSLEMALYGLRNWNRIIGILSRSIKANHKHLENFKARNPKVIPNSAPPGSIGVLKVPQRFKSGHIFAAALAKKSVWTRAGENFEMPGYVRVSYFSTPAQFRSALKKIETFYE